MLINGLLGLAAWMLIGVKYCYEGYHQNNLTTKIHTEALNYCIGKHFVDNAPWLNRIRGLTYSIESLQIEA